MAEYFTARGMPVPRELTRGPLSDWRRNVTVILTIAVLAVGFKILDIDLSRSIPATWAKCCSSSSSSTGA